MGDYIKKEAWEMCRLRKAEQNGELSGIDRVNMSKKLFGHKRCHKTYTK